MTIPSGTTDVYTDFQGLADLRLSATKRDPDALKAAAKQFESIFIQQMLKSMRDASLGEGLFDSEEGKFYQDMFDKQISLDITKGRGIGLADMIIKQMSATIEDVEHTDENLPVIQNPGSVKDQAVERDRADSITSEP